MYLPSSTSILLMTFSSSSGQRSQILVAVDIFYLASPDAFAAVKSWPSRYETSVLIGRRAVALTYTVQYLISVCSSGAELYLALVMPGIASLQPEIQQLEVQPNVWSLEWTRKPHWIKIKTISGWSYDFKYSFCVKMISLHDV